MKILFLFCFTGLIQVLTAQQIPDTSYHPKIGSPAYTAEGGPFVYIDAAHQNFHTRTGRYQSFARLLEADGYRVVDNNKKFSNASLQGINLLVIANAEPVNATEPVVAPTSSAFTDTEIKAVEKWVRGGGSLLLIADHMPFAGAAAQLAAAFDFTFYDGFALVKPGDGLFDFKRSDGSLAEVVVTRGRNHTEQITQVRSFTGQGFRIPPSAESILNLNDTQSIYLTDTMWVFNDRVRTIPASGLSQGALLEYGAGRVVCYGEAAMFSAQLAGPNRFKAGMNTQEAAQNFQLLLNTIHWLDYIL
ncbi:MAG: DUF4350 domain-containing protein [Lewinellaceae bacterium]|nr:DUF4350 domain-containing protein [Saprospiraceae bacterium]MCB9271829.1 DUF4350 domain-containing protein [Lewinellaceae bacterium]HPG09785.1 DUF4350 domain-containing protein [Saprospiraceae bacterium]